MCFGNWNPTNNLYLWSSEETLWVRRKVSPDFWEMPAVRRKKKGEKLSEVHVGEKCICHLSCHHPRLKSTFPRFLPSSFIIILLSSHTFTFSWIWIPILCHLFLSSSSTHHLTFCSTRKEQKLLHYPISFHLDLANLLLLVIFRSENIILYLILQV